MNPRDPHQAAWEAVHVQEANESSPRKDSNRRERDGKRVRGRSGMAYEMRDLVYSSTGFFR